MLASFNRLSNPIVSRLTVTVRSRLCSCPAMPTLFGSIRRLLEALGLNPDNVVTLSGQALVDEVDGQLTGTFLEAAAVYYQTEVFRRFHEEAVLAMQDFSRHLHAMGVTAVGDVAITGESPDDMVYPELYERALAAKIGRASCRERV